MNYNAYTNKKIVSKLNKNFQMNNPTSIKSLRSIINQTKISLNQYINNRSSTQKYGIKKIPNNKLTYFEKLKGRMTENKNNMNNQQIQQEYTPLKNNKNHFQNYEQNYQRQYQQRHSNLNKISNRNIVQNRSLDKNKTKSKNKNQYCQIPQRMSFQPKNKMKTQNIILFQKDRTMTLKNMQKNKYLYHLPPRPSYQNSKQNKKSQKIITQQFITPPIIQYNNTTDQLNLQKDQMIENIRSHRRLNFLKQQQRKSQIIKYSKKFEKICQNSYFSSLNEKIQSNFIEINQVLGTGAYAYVKLGILKNIFIGEFKLAIKIYQKYKLVQPNRKKRVMKEINILSKLNHPNIIKLFGAYENKRQIHMVFQHLQNAITLQEYFKHKSFMFEDLDQLFFIFNQIAKGLEYLHSIRIAHRDIKPDNILLSFQNNILVVKIIDFGFAINSQFSKTQCGTPNFMAPEIFSQKQYSTYATDMWSFGILMYYLCEGKYPFRGYNQKSLIKSIIEGHILFQKTHQIFKNCILNLLQKRVSQRSNSQELIKWFTKIANK